MFFRRHTLDFLQLFLNVVQYFILPTVIVDNEIDFGLMAHLAPIIHKNLNFLTLSQPNIINRKVNLQPKLH